MISFVESRPIDSYDQTQLSKYLCGVIAAIVVFIYVPAFWLFIISFYPFASLPSSTNSPIIVRNDILSPLEAKYDRVILFLIDGLAFEVVKQNHQSNFPFISKYSSQIKLFKAYAHAPTVTLPRLRALMSGQMPQFISDIISNLIETSSSNSSTTEDSVLFQSHLKHPDKPIHLFGDQTWFKLFGRQIFSNQSQGTTSLFVKDTVFVDTNVTQNVFVEHESILLHEPWRFLILHYLGFDHIGHCGLLHTPLMHSKLQEMNQAIEQVIEKHVNDDRTLLIVLSDHGMTDQGNHGGASQQETDSFLLFFSRQFHNSANVWSHIEQVNQIDLAPTLSLLLSQPIPSKSIGKIIPQLFETGDELQKAAQINSLHMIQQTKYNYSLITDYLQYQKQQSTQFSYQVSQRDVLGIVLSIGLLLLGTVLTALYFYYYNALSLRPEVYYPLFIWTFVIYLYLYFLHCNSYSEGICHPFARVPIALSTIGYGYAIFFLHQFVTVIRSYRFYHKTSSTKLEKWSQQVYEWFGYFICAFSIVALLSSSFVEEEHYLWYHSATITCFFLWISSLNNATKKQQIYYLLLLISCKWLQGYNSSGINFAHLPSLTDTWIITHSASIVQFILFTSIIVVDWMRMLVYASYSSRPFYWLYRFEQIIFSLIAFLGACCKLFGVFLCLIPYLYVGCLVCVGLSFLNQFVINIQIVYTLKDRAQHCIERIQMIIFLMLCLVNRSEQSALLLVLGLFLALLHALCKQQVQYSGLFMLNRPFSIQMAFFIFSRMSYFIFGRSISIATLDFSEAYLGLSEYQPVLLFILCTVLLFGAPMILFLEQVKLMCFEQQQSSAIIRKAYQTTLFPSKITTNSVAHFYFKIVLHHLLWRCALLLVTCIITYAMQNHLFIWSVFSPKVFFEIGWTMYYVLTLLAGAFTVLCTMAFEMVYG